MGDIVVCVVLVFLMQLQTRVARYPAVLSIRHELGSRTIQSPALRYPNRHPRKRFPRSQSCVRFLPRTRTKHLGWNEHLFFNKSSLVCWDIKTTQLGGRLYCHGLTLAISPSGPFPRSSSALDPSACKTKIPRLSGSQYSPLHPIRSICSSCGFLPTFFYMQL
jgi:hypothetical protein